MRQEIPDPRMLELAQQLLAHEAAASNSSEPHSPPVFRVFDGLRRPIGRLAGASGFSALLSRALTLAKLQVPNLAAVKVKPNGSLEGLSELSDSAASEGGVVLIVEWLGLLVAFIGETLTMRILLDVWPDVTDFGTRPSGGNEHAPRK